MVDDFFVAVKVIWQTRQTDSQGLMLLGDGPLAALVASLGTHLVVYGQRYFTLQPLSAIIYFRLCAVL